MQHRLRLHSNDSTFHVRYGIEGEKVTYGVCKKVRGVRARSPSGSAPQSIFGNTCIETRARRACEAARPGAAVYSAGSARAVPVMAPLP